MSTGLPKRFDPERLAAQDVVLEGALDTGMMPRLGAMLATRETKPVRVDLRAQRDDAKRLLLTGEAGAELDLVCQRCMETVTLPVETRIALAVVADEEAARGLPAEFDPLLRERDADIDLPELVEDELILALPPVPMHPDETECGERARYGREAAEPSGGAKRESPFAVLKKLKNGNH